MATRRLFIRAASFKNLENSGRNEPGFDSLSDTLVYVYPVQRNAEGEGKREPLSYLAIITSFEPLAGIVFVILRSLHRLLASIERTSTTIAPRDCTLNGKLINVANTLTHLSVLSAFADNFYYFFDRPLLRARIPRLRSGFHVRA